MKWLSKRQKQILTKIGILMVGAVGLTWLLEYRNRLNSATEAVDFIVNAPRVFIFSVFLMFLIVLFIYGLVRKPFKALGITEALVITVGYIHITKFSFRGNPLFPEDFQLSSEAGTLTKFVDSVGIVKTVIAVVLVIILAHIYDRLTEKWLGRESEVRKSVWWRRYKIASRIAIMAVSVAMFLLCTGFVRSHAGAKEEEVAFLNTKFVAWNQVDNYNKNGFLLGFLYNLNQLEIQAPEGYTEEKITEIKSVLGETETGEELRDINIILVLNESFYDPEKIMDYYGILGGEVTPNLHEIQKKYPSGTMFSVDYGGGTANIEFEVLTGLTNYWLSTVPYTNLLPKKKTVPSIATQMKTLGYETVALHPFSGGMYKRNTVLPILGFDKFITEEDFQNTEKSGESEYINDRSAYKEVIDLIQVREKPQLVHLVTMQNHAPYEENEYGESKFVVTKAETEAEKYQLETYLMTLNLSDQFLGEFIDELEKFDEKTVVLFYGDHAAATIPQVVWNDKKEMRDLAYQTPYFIYSNFELEKMTEKLPMTTSNCLVSTLLDLLDAKKTEVQMLLDEVCLEEPILTDNYLGNEGVFMSTALSNYQLLTYDLVAGKQYGI